MAKEIWQGGVPVGTSGGMGHGLCPAQPCKWRREGEILVDVPSLKAAFAQLGRCNTGDLPEVTVVDQRCFGAGRAAYHGSVPFRGAALLRPLGEGGWWQQAGRQQSSAGPLGGSQVRYNE